ncbi:MAG TPA: Trp biosynthesis-associated membrane protein [Nakamurella sp.]
MTTRPDRPTARPAAVLAILVLLGAAACAGAAAMTWWTADYVDPLSGPLTLTASGADCLPELVPVALVALAGFGACLATRGWFRRLIGILLLAGGLLVSVRAAMAMGGAPAALTTALVRPADPAGPAELHPAGPLLALVGGALLALAGALVAAGLGGRRRLGARYDAPSPAAPARRTDPASTDPADWWKALDAGTDPTDPAASKGPSPGGYHDDNERAT